ncbi:8070_t:CDS:2, partial [Entrophospora sp. SA101]
DRTGDINGQYGGGGAYQQGGYGGGQQQPQYVEMAQIGQDDVGAFFDEVSSISDMIRKAQANISQIDELHSRTLGTIAEDERIKRQLESITSETRGILTQIKDRIKKLEASNLKQAKSGDIEVRKAQLMNSTRFGAAKEALKEVQERHDDIKKIEKTIEELANLFHEMSIIVEAQDQTIVAIEQEATQVSTNMEQGAQHVDKALTSARAARKKKWYCLGIGIILLIVLAIVIYLFVIKPMLDNKKQK